MDESSATAALVAAAVGEPVNAITPLTGGCIASVYRCDLRDGRSVVAKAGRQSGVGPRSGLTPEGFMLTYLAEQSRLPVPRVLSCSDSLLVMEFVESDGRMTSAAERHAAELLASLHSIKAPMFGLHRDTLIGPIPLPNTPSPSWVEFFRDRRMLYLASLAAGAGRLCSGTMTRLEAMASRLGEFLPDNPTPSLVHGDIWSGNVLVRAGEIAAFIDPAIYYGHAEIELAFIRLFSTFGDVFFEEYARILRIEPGFFGGREHVYNLFPLLVHAHLFGGHYEGEILNNLRRLGF